MEATDLRNQCASSEVSLRSRKALVIVYCSLLLPDSERRRKGWPGRLVGKVIHWVNQIGTRPCLSGPDGEAGTLVAVFPRVPFASAVSFD
jgi:hypothetical protein